jgi:ATP-dependent Lon protease
MRDDPQEGYRSQARPDATTLKRLETLAASASHFQRLFDLILAAARAANLTGRPRQWPPLLLLGEPGIGKTYVAREIAQRFGIPFESLSMPNISGSGTFNGLDTSWRSPKIGAVAKALIASGSANPLFLLDEIDKTPGQHSEFGDPLGPLYDLLEPTSASTYRDDFLKTRFAADTIFWLATANSTVSLSAALLDRFIVIEVDRPSEMQMSAIIECQSAGKRNPVSASKRDPCILMTGPT